MSRLRLAAFALSLVLAVGLMPAVALASDSGAHVVEPMSLSDPPTPSAPGKPAISWVKYKTYSAYEINAVVYDGTPVGRNAGDYLGEGIAVTLEPSTADFDCFFAVASKTMKTPASLASGSHPDNGSVFDGSIAYKGNTFYTGALDPNTTYYVYVATGNVISPGYIVRGAVWSEWSDPVTVKTGPAKKTGKKANTITAKAKTVTLKASNLKKKAQSVKASKAFTVKNAKGAVTYKATKDVTKGAMKKVTVAKGGKVTMKRGTKAGTYKLKVRVTAAGDSTYASGSKTVTLAVKVK